MSVHTTLACQLINPSLEALKVFLEKNLKNVRAFQGCLDVKVFFDTENSEMLLEEKWESIEHHQKYLKFIEANGVLGELASFLKGPPDIKYFEKEAI
jgi:quinol monooxygenase YgiN